MATPRLKRSNISMLHIPFSKLSEKEIDSNTLTFLRHNYFLPGHLEKVLLGKRFRSPADVLRSAEIREAASPLELMKLVVPPKHDQPPIDPGDGLLSVRAIRPDRTGLVVELWTLASGKYRLVLSYPESELISIEIDGNGEVDPATMRLGGFWWWEWPKLARETRELIYRRMANERAQADLLKLAEISLDAQTRFDSVILPVRKVAQLLIFFNSITVTDGGGTGDLPPVVPGSQANEDGEAYDPNGMDPKDFPESDKCSRSFDWPFERCCVAHDYCYRRNPRGCDECARLQCDLDFLQCMLRVAGPSAELQQMAVVYFLAVRAFGDGSFEYCASSRGDGSFNLSKVLILSDVAVGGLVGASVASVEGIGIGIAAGAITTAVAVALAGKLTCEFCGQIEDWIEECEADRKKREERCEKLKRKCKKLRNPWKKLRCRLAFFWNCVVADIILKGLCRLVKTLRLVIC